MKTRRSSKWDNYRRSQNIRAPRVCWQPTVPSWEKEFCKVIGSLDWETLLQMKKFIHLYDNVIKWNDFAGEQAFCNSKKRFWAKINGLQCDIPLPDPDAYVDKIYWNSKIDPELLSDLECNPVILNTEEDHDPVIIFGGSLISNQAFLSSGWGENEEKLDVRLIFHLLIMMILGSKTGAMHLIASQQLDGRVLIEEPKVFLGYKSRPISRNA